MGSLATADILYAVDVPIQDGIANWNALAPMAPLMGAGDVMVQYDQAYEHYDIPHPQLLALAAPAHAASGSPTPMSYGAPRPNVSTVSTLDEQDLAVPANVGWPAPLVTYTVKNPRAMLRGESDSGAIVMDGDATGLNNLAGLGLLNTDSAIYYAGTLATDTSRLHELAVLGAQLVVTDTNRKQAFRWDTLTANAGYTETPSENPAKTDQSDSPVELFPGSTITSKTYASYVGAVNVTASSYGNSVSYTPEDQAYSAIDGNFDTAWIAGTFVPDPAGQWWQAQFQQAGHDRSHHGGATPTRRPLALGLLGHPHLRRQGPDPLRPDQGLARDERPDALLPHPHVPHLAGHPRRHHRQPRPRRCRPPPSDSPRSRSRASRSTQVLQMPTQMLSSLGTASQNNRVTLVMTRDRTSQFPPRSDPETTICAHLHACPRRAPSPSRGAPACPRSSPTTRSTGWWAGHPVRRSGVESAYSTGRLPGDLRATASATIDGNPQTAWQPGLGTAAQHGVSLTYNLTKQTTLNQLSMQVIADGRHSVPTSMTIASGTQVRHVTLPPHRGQHRSQRHHDRARELPRPERKPVRGDLHRHPAGVRGQLLLGRSAGPPHRHRGDRHPRRAGGADAGDGARQLRVEPAEHRRQADRRRGRRHHRSGAQRRRAPGRCPAARTPRASRCRPGPTSCRRPSGTGRTAPPTRPRAPAGTSTSSSGLGGRGHGGTRGDTDLGRHPDPPGHPAGSGAAGDPDGPAHRRPRRRRQRGDDSFELVLGQSVNKGWHAVAQPGPDAPAGSRAVDLGTPQLVDGFANGWHVTAADLQTLGGADFTVALDLDPSARGVGRAGRVGGDAPALPGARLPAHPLASGHPGSPAPAAARSGRTGCTRASTVPPFDSPALTLPSFRDTSGVGEPYGWRLRYPACPSRRRRDGWGRRAGDAVDRGAGRGGAGGDRSDPPLAAAPSPPSPPWPPSSPAASTSCADRPCTISCPARTGTARS